MVLLPARNLFGANHFFVKFCCKFLAFFSFWPLKTLKMHISTSVLDVQHPNAGQTIQQMMLLVLMFWLSITRS